MEEASARRERLRALREAVKLSEAPVQSVPSVPSEAAVPSIEDERAVEGDVANDVTSQDEAQAGEASLEVHFRNYLPRDNQLHGAKLPPPDRPKFEDPIAPNAADAERTEDPLTSIAPRKPDWDLRRDVAKRLEKLERRTQRAMVELMYEEEKRRQEDAGGQEDEVDNEVLGNGNAVSVEQ